MLYVEIYVAIIISKIMSQMTTGHRKGVTVSCLDKSRLKLSSCVVIMLSCDVIS